MEEIFCFYCGLGNSGQLGPCGSRLERMSKLSDMLKIFRRNYSDVVGVDVGASGTKVVRLKRIRGVITVMAADILPAVVLPEAEETVIAPLVLSKALKGRYAALAVSKAGGVVKLLSFPAHAGKSTDDHVHELMGLGDATQYRLGYELITESRTETRVLAAALPDESARRLCQLFPAGVPAPCSIEIAGLASLTAFSHACSDDDGPDGRVVVDFGEGVTLVAFFNKNTMGLVRKFDFGASAILKRLQDSLGVEREVALGILNDGSFDVTKIVHQAMESFLQQLIISWDFVERRENIRIGKLYVCGGGVGIPLWAQEMEQATGQVPVKWDPFKGLAVQPGAMPEDFKGQEPRFAAAVGAALAVLKVG